MPKLIQLIAILVMLMPIGVFRSSAQGDSTQSPAVLGVKKIATLNGVLSRPVDAADESTSLAIDLIQESLIVLRRDNPDEDPAWVGELAATFGHAPKDDAGTQNAYVFDLRPNVTWHDGVMFTAEDVIFTFNAIRSPDLQSPYKAQLDSVLAPTDTSGNACIGSSSGLATSSENSGGGTCPYYAPNAQTVVVYGNGVPEQTFYEAMIVPIVPKHIWEGVQPTFAAWSQDPGSTGEDAARVVGTGQYQFVARTRYIDNCGADITPDRPPSLQDEDLRLKRNARFGARTLSWPDHPEYLLKVYTCQLSDLTLSDRLDLAISMGSVDADSLTQIRMYEVVGDGIELAPGHQFEIAKPPFNTNMIDAGILDKARNDFSDIGFDQGILAP